MMMLMQFVPLSTTLAILFLASWTLREPVDPFDLSGLTAVGKIEYLLLWNSVQEKMQPYMTLFNKSFFFPTGKSSKYKKCCCISNPWLCHLYCRSS
jgi:hypothetical protein